MVSDLSLVIPNKDDSDVISKNFDNVTQYLQRICNNFEILIITNGSSKKTINQIDALINLNSKCRQIVVDKAGKGRAVKVGLENAKYNNVLISDADFSVAIEEVEKFILNNKFLSPLIIGTRRDFSSENINSPLRRKFFGGIYIFFVQKLFRFKFTDTQCGFKYINLIEFRQSKNLTTYGFSFDLELILLAIQNNIKITEVPVKYIHNNNSSVNLFKDSLSMFISALKLYKKYIN